MVAAGPSRVDGCAFDRSTTSKFSQSLPGIRVI